MNQERPRVVVIQRTSDHGCIITLLLLIIAWPLAILYWVLRLVVWALRSVLDLVTLGMFRRRR
jgi:hypothetical protein